MNTALQTFQFQSHQLTAITDEVGAPWFIAKEVAEILEYTDAYEMTKKLDEDEIQNRQIAGFGNRGVNIINESGLYASILTSKKPAAKVFKKWVTSEVLPSIHKTGGYSVQPSLPSNDYAALQRKYITLLEQENSRLKNQPVPASAQTSFGAMRAWTPEEDALIRTLKAQGLGNTRIGLQLGRTENSVRCHLQYMTKRQGGAA